MKKINHFKAMSLWQIAQKATSSAICDSFNSRTKREEEKFTDKMWKDAQKAFCKKLNEYINESKL